MSLKNRMKVVAAAVSIAVASFAVGAEEMIVNGNFSDGTNGWNISGDGKWKNCRAEVVDVESGGKAIKFKIETNTETMKPWSLFMRQRIAKPIKKDTPLSLSFKVKGTGIQDIFCCVEENKEPYKKSVKSEVKITEQWQTVKLEGKALDDYEADGWKIAFNLAYGTGEIYISDVKLESK